MTNGVEGPHSYLQCRFFQSRGNDMCSRKMPTFVDKSSSCCLTAPHIRVVCQPLHHPSLLLAKSGEIARENYVTQPTIDTSRAPRVREHPTRPEVEVMVASSCKLKASRQPFNSSGPIVDGLKLSRTMLPRAERHFNYRKPHDMRE